MFALLPALLLSLLVLPETSANKPDLLIDNGVVPWMGPRSLPLWLPLPEYSGFLARDVSASVAAGLTFRPFADTARDTVEWASSGREVARTGLTRDEETQLLDTWRRRDRG